MRRVDGTPATSKLQADVKAEGLAAQGSHSGMWTSSSLTFFTLNYYDARINSMIDAHHNAVKHAANPVSSYVVKF